MSELRLKRQRFRKLLFLTCILSLFLVSLCILNACGYTSIQFCLFNKITSLNCPACGSTRMVVSLLNGRVYQAFRYNTFIFISIPYIIIMYIRCSISYVLTGRLSKAICKSLLVYMILLILFGIIRNLPMFSSLAPTDIN